MSQNEITVAQALRILSAELDHAVSLRQMAEMIHERLHKRAAEGTVRNCLRWAEAEHGWVHVARAQYLPLRLALDGARFRCWPFERDIHSGQLPAAHFYPFALFRGASFPRIYDEQGNELALIERPQTEWQLPLGHLTLDLRQWFQQHQMKVGDSILVEVRYKTQLEFHLAYEPAAAFRAEAVAQQDRALCDAIAQRLSAAPMLAERIILPIVASAPWRAAYPGQPWQYLVLEDPRMFLRNDVELMLRDRSSPLLWERLFDHRQAVFRPGQVTTARVSPIARELQEEINALQQAIQRSREQDARAGVWDGTFAMAAVDALERDNDDDDDDDDLFDLDWFERYPSAFRLTDEALQRVYQLLPEDTRQRLAQATQEEAEVILAQQLNYLLVRAPDLFPRIEDLGIVPIGSSETVTDQREAALLIDPDDLSGFFSDDDDDFDDDDFFADDDDDEDEGEYQALERNHLLLAQFRDYLREMGKKAETFHAHRRLVRLYGDFLAGFYHRSLEQGDYATLDEFLFYYYPRHFHHPSGRQARDLCGSLRQFYGFLKDRGIIQDDRFARAIWQRRMQAAQLVSLYEKVARRYPEQAELRASLFQPYLA